MGLKFDKFVLFFYRLSHHESWFEKRLQVLSWNVQNIDSN
ncbi:hypothetical protein ES332_D05G218000v1 [Gossypium tomentosum]|uniref:Uncharacterized protein n=1 Tax=Gossypium tomentosum TaxID=34277 RepID=A0A5D2KXV5_GOSTO|nr:hypothetical protein ES332_D05G218000v1 [Gossypium tomentosum]